MSNEGSDRIRELMNALGPALEKMYINEKKILDETLRGHFPNLKTKEWIVCAGIACTVSDNEYCDVDFVVYYCLNVQTNKIFYDEADVKRTIKEMSEKGIVKYEKTWFSKSPICENFIRPHTELYMSGYVENEIVYCWRKEFEYAVKGTFSVHKTESQELDQE